MRSTTHPSGPALLPRPAPLRSGPELLRGHPVHRRSSVVVDGQRLELRPVVPSDLDGIDRFVRGLSPRSRFLRFHAAVRRLSSGQLAGLVDVDHHDRETVVVRDTSGAVVALGQYAGVGRGVAELGLAVADDWHRRGLATRVVAWLADAAREEGFRAFTASVLAENRAAIGLFDRWPGTVQVERHGTAVEVLLCLDPYEATALPAAAAADAASAPA
ncbi:MAG: GNAT family N-acetyltransferase [Actinobacteria bacterium]|nr:GNAT family N-acetyltransferase [Actinomycetota bacterium]